MRNTVYVAQSLDGYLAGPNGELDWLEDVDNPANSDFGFADFMASVDAVIMGRNTFEKVLSMGEWIYEKPVYVASVSLDELPGSAEGKAFLLRGSPVEMVRQLHANGYKNLYIDGGAVIQSFLRADLIDELILTTVPVLLGKGIPLFSALPMPIKLRLISAEVLENQLVKATYQVHKVPETRTDCARGQRLL